LRLATWPPISHSLNARQIAARNRVNSLANSRSILVADLAREPTQQALTVAPGDGQAIGGTKVMAPSGWLAVRPSGTEFVYKVYAESLRGVVPLRDLQEAAHAIVIEALMRCAAASVPQ
jgi:phosphoglucomutase